MSGYKTWIGAGIMAAGAFLNFIGYAELAEAFKTFAFGVLAVGIGHKVEKATK